VRQGRFADLTALLQRASGEGAALTRRQFVDAVHRCGEIGDSEHASKLLAMMVAQGLIVTKRDAAAALSACSSAADLNSEHIQEVIKIAHTTTDDLSAYYDLLVAVYCKDSDKAIEVLQCLRTAGVDIDVEKLLAMFTKADENVMFQQLVDKYAQVPEASSSKSQRTGKRTKDVKVKRLLTALSNCSGNLPSTIVDILLEVDSGLQLVPERFVGVVDTYLKETGQVMSAELGSSIMAVAMHFNGVSERNALPFREETASLFEDKLIPWTDEIQRYTLNYLSPLYVADHKNFIARLASFDLETLIPKPAPGQVESNRVKGLRQHQEARSVEFRFQANSSTNNFDAAIENLKTIDPAQLRDKFIVDRCQQLLRGMIQQHHDKMGRRYTQNLEDTIDLINEKFPGTLQQKNYIEIAALLSEKRTKQHRLLAEKILTKHVNDDPNDLRGIVVDEESKMRLVRYYASRGLMNRVEELMADITDIDAAPRDRFRVHEYVLEGYIASRFKLVNGGHWSTISKAEDVYNKIRADFPEYYAEKKEFIDACMIVGYAYCLGQETDAKRQAVWDSKLNDVVALYLGTSSIAQGSEPTKQQQALAKKSEFNLRRSMPKAIQAIVGAYVRSGKHERLVQISTNTAMHGDGTPKSPYISDIIIEEFATRILLDWGNQEKAVTQAAAKKRRQVIDSLAQIMSSRETLKGAAVLSAVKVAKRDGSDEHLKQFLQFVGKVNYDAYDDAAAAKFRQDVLEAARGTQAASDPSQNPSW